MPMLLEDAAGGHMATGSINRVSLVLIALTSVMSGAVAAQKPVIQSHVISEYQPSPDTLDGFVSSCDIVVLGAVTRARNAPQFNGPANIAARTEYSFIVMDVVKNASTLKRGPITILRDGGDVDLGDRIIH